MQPATMSDGSHADGCRAWWLLCCCSTSALLHVVVKGGVVMHRAPVQMAMEAAERAAVGKVAAKAVEMKMVAQGAVDHSWQPRGLRACHGARSRLGS